MASMGDGPACAPGPASALDHVPYLFRVSASSGSRLFSLVSEGLNEIAMREREREREGEREREEGERERREGERAGSSPGVSHWITCLTCFGFRLSEQLLPRNVKRFRGGLVFKAHRWLYH